jgi:hypothetical protein
VENLCKNGSLRFTHPTKLPPSMGLHASGKGPLSSDLALKSGIDNHPSTLLTSAASTIERIGPNKIGQSEVDWVTGPVGQLAGQPNRKKPTALRGVVGVWNCESSDYIRGRDGACFHAVGFLARSERLEHNQGHGLFLSRDPIA